MENYTAFADVTPVSDSISRVMGSIGLENCKDLEKSGLIRLLLAGQSYSDAALLKAAEQLENGQLLWAFSPYSRDIKATNLKFTHVPATSTRVLLTKIADHLLRFIAVQEVGSPLNPIVESKRDKIISSATLHEFNPLVGTKADYQISVHEELYCFTLDLKPSQKIVVYFPDDFSRQRNRLALFNSTLLSNTLNASVLVWQDPTKSSAPTLGCTWWLGTENNDVIPGAVQILKRILRSIGLKEQDVIFAGVREGSFPALAVGSEVPGSTVIVDAPITNLLDDCPASYQPEKAISECLNFDASTIESTSLNYRVDVTKRFQRMENLPNIVWIRNAYRGDLGEEQFNRFSQRVSTIPSPEISRIRCIETRTPYDDSLGIGCLPLMEFANHINSLTFRSFK